MDGTNNDETFPCESGDNVTDAKAPEFPAKVGWHHIMAQWRVVRVDIGGEGGVANLLEYLPGPAIESEETAKAVGVGQRPVRDETEIKEPKKDERIVSPPALAEFVPKVEDGCIVDELEDADDRNHLALIIVGEHPPLG